MTKIEDRQYAKGFLAAANLARFPEEFEILRAAAEKIAAKPEPSPWSHDLGAVPVVGFFLASYGDAEAPEVWDADQWHRCMADNPPKFLPITEAHAVVAWAPIP